MKSQQYTRALVHVYFVCEAVVLKQAAKCLSFGVSQEEVKMLVCNYISTFYTLRCERNCAGSKQHVKVVPAKDKRRCALCA